MTDMEMTDTNNNGDADFSAAIAEEIIDPEAMEDFDNLAHEIGMTPEQSESVWNWMVKGAIRLMEKSKNDLDRSRSESEEALRREFGDRYEIRRKSAVDLIRRFGGEDTLQFMNASGIADCREVVSFLMKLSEVLGEDRGLIGEKRQDFMSDGRLKDEICRLMAQKAYMSAADPSHDSIVNKVYALRRRLCGE